MCDLLLVIGTRAEVKPAADLITMAKSVQARVVVVNPGEHVAGDLADLTLSGAAGEVVPVLLRDVMEMTRISNWSLPRWRVFT